MPVFSLSPLLRPLLGVMLVLTSASVARAQTADNVLLVINEASADSVQVGEYYARKRAIPADHIVRLKAPTTESISVVQFTSTIQSPIARWLSRHSLQDRILYLVLAKDIPLRILGTGGRDGTVASVDSELTLLYRRMLGIEMPAVGRVPNPYFLGDRDIREARPFSRLTHDIYLVTRLDAFTVAEALQLIDRGVAPASDGRFVLDQKATFVDRGGDEWLREAADRLTAAGAKATLESTTALATSTDPVMGYYSWGSNDPASQRRRSGLTFADGAIGGTFVSTDLRTFRTPPATWNPSEPSGGPTFAGSFQSLAADLIRDGITGVSGHVDEPFLDATVRPEILFPAYVSGMNLAEAFYLALPFLSWQTIIVGDPLCTPFSRTVLVPEQIHRGLDERADLPSVFAERRRAMFPAGSLPEAVNLVLRADAAFARDNQADIEPLLARAVDLDPRLIDVQLRLAALYETRKDFDREIERYRRVIAVDPKHVIALNNLAYRMAVEKKDPTGALPFAERAFAIAQNAAVADTLGWIQHLRGDDRTARNLIDRALLLNTTEGEIYFHAAVVYAALKDRPRARLAIAAALKLRPSLAERDDVKALQAALR